MPSIAVVESARVGVPLIHTLTLLDKETAGGKNVFGHDAVKCGPSGGDVTEVSYQSYLKTRDSCGFQGVGPLQLTYGPIQDKADLMGGCWRPEINVRVGLQVFLGFLVNNSVRDAYSLWNTGKAGSTPYATDALVLVDSWQRLLNSVP